MPMKNINSADTTQQNNPYFSIILPIYNVDQYLDQCIQSVLGQKYHDYEIILVDDGSTDNSPEICDVYAAQYDHIRVIHKPNGGLSSARNAGVEKARGTYIWWVDSDDWIEQDALTVLHLATYKKFPDVVKFNFFRMGEQKKQIMCQVPSGLYEDEASLERLINKGFYHPGKFSLSAWGHIYKNSFLKENKLSFVSERVIGSEDYLFNLSVLVAARHIEVIEEPLYNYRLRPGSLTQGYRKDLPEKYTELYRQLRFHYSQMGKLAHYQGRICNFYVWHLLHGTCLANEYRNTEEHTRTEGRKNVRMFLKKPEFQQAVRNCDVHMFSKSQKIQLLAMRLKVEPLFYWLFVVKPWYKKRVYHDN